ncbi:hypothetical protein Mapa_014742 [Marchantia paleacea]|nr:hypothetical protein Mapa_014742 [Marchantia paleacea]
MPSYQIVRMNVYLSSIDAQEMQARTDDVSAVLSSSSVPHGDRDLRYYLAASCAHMYIDRTRLHRTLTSPRSSNPTAPHRTCCYFYHCKAFITFSTKPNIPWLLDPPAIPPALLSDYNRRHHDAI